MSKLTTAQAKTIEEYWSNLEDLKRQLRFREWELTSNHSVDEKTGGGKSNRVSDTTGDRAVLLLSDEKYLHYRKIVQSIDQTYESADQDMQTIANMRYWDKDGVYEWEDIADKLYISRSKVLRKRNLLIDKTAERLGWL